MRFWDNSAVVPLIFREPTSESLDELLAEDGGMAVWWGTWVECAVTISRLKRDGKLGEEFERETRSALGRLAVDWMEVEPMDDVRLLASILSKDHPLKAAASFQLAAGRNFICLDRTLRRAATNEGFDVFPEAA
ncbi:MAG: type II toxin-antitoxin system VapC family toxin [Actinomycetota bacterium]|nr:type II toxin-antitoxin system VapC family toxin [Actinomycetota bacterium]